MSGITSFAPGASLPRHFHNCEGSVFLLGGFANPRLTGLNVGWRRAI
jgi:hypothetical protein